MDKENFIYNPVRPCKFSFIGETMVKETLKVSPNFSHYFDKIFPPDLQKAVAYKNFENLRKEYFESKMQNSNVTEEIDVKGGKGGKKYFETNRKFNRLVPITYHRTTAPRISASGSTFHGMKKNFLIENLKDLSKNANVAFIDFDMSAAHSRIARYLLSKPGFMDASLKDPEFWGTQVSRLRCFYDQMNIDLPDKNVKKILKVGLYSSMNGGNPISDERMLSNLQDNAEGYITKEGLSDVDLIKTSPIWGATRKMLEGFDLINEVRTLNESCAKFEGPEKYATYTIDKINPYIVESKHKGISRVLQGFEIVLLSILLYDLLNYKFLPISLDHDGILLMCKPDVDPNKICKQLSSNKSNFYQWSEYLLGEGLPIEPKRHILNGQYIEY